VVCASLHQAERIFLMFQIVASGRYRRLKSATAPHRERLEELYGNQSMFCSVENYKRYLQATLASRTCLETMLEVSHIGALYSGWDQSKLEQELLSDIDDIADVDIALVVEPKRTSQPVDLATVIGTLYALESTVSGVQNRAEQVSLLGFDGNRGARHLIKQSSSLVLWSQALKLIEITPFDDDDEERCMFAAIAALGAFEFNYLKVFNHVARQPA